MDNGIKRVTVKDIANALQISPGTVSKALSEKKGISDALRTKVLDTAAAMGYHVNRTAQSLARKLIHIGVIYPATWRQYYDEVIRGMERALSSLRDYNVTGEFVSFSSLYSSGELSAIAHDFAKKQVDAVVLCPGSISNCAATLLDLKEHNIPVFLVGNDINPDLRIACIQVNAFLAGAMAGEMMNYLVPEGANLIAFIGDKSLREHTDKLNGFRNELSGGRQLVGCFETQDEPKVAAYLIDKAVQEIPNIQGVYVATGNSVAICDVLRRREETRHIRMIVTDYFDELQPYVQDRQINAIIFQHPDLQGERAILQCYEYITRRTLKEQTLIVPTVLLRNSLTAFVGNQFK